jgi:hypothetical protein
MNIKSVKSKNPCKSVIQQSYEITKAHSSESKVERMDREGTKFIASIQKSSDDYYNKKL